LTLLAEMRERGGATQQYLFPGNSPNKPLQGIKKFWRSITEQAGLGDYRLHDNRHTHASHLVSSGLSLEIVGRLLGHTNPLTTKRYAHLSDHPLRAAAECFGSKMDALQKAGDAEVVPVPSPQLRT
jgi:site-specific recombinase XerD